MMAPGANPTRHPGVGFVPGITSRAVLKEKRPRYLAVRASSALWNEGDTAVPKQHEASRFATPRETAHLAKCRNGDRGTKASWQDSCTSSLLARCSNVSTDRSVILLIEDDDLLRMIFSRSFRRRGFGVIEARDVASGRDALRTQSFDVVVSDYELGDGTALDLLDDVPDRRDFFLMSGRVPLPRIDEVTAHAKPLDLRAFCAAIGERLREKLCLQPVTDEELSATG